MGNVAAGELKRYTSSIIFTICKNEATAARLHGYSTLLTLAFSVLNQSAMAMVAQAEEANSAILSVQLTNRTMLL